MEGGAWWATVHGVAKSQIRLSDFTFTLRFHALEKEMALHSSVLALRIPGTGKPGWAAVYGVAQSRTRLKRLSSSGSSSTCFPLLPHACTMSGYRSIPSLKSLKNNQGKKMSEKITTHDKRSKMIMKEKVKFAQSCPTVCDPRNYTVRGTLQARILEWVAFPFSRGSSQPRD